jgi:hypothetical protein
MKKVQIESKIGAKQATSFFRKLEVKANPSGKLPPPRERRKIDPRKVLGTNQPFLKQRPKINPNVNQDIEWESIPVIKTFCGVESDPEEDRKTSNDSQSIADKILSESIIESDLAKEVAAWHTRIKAFMARIHDSRICTQQFIQKIKQLKEFKEEVASEYRKLVLMKNAEQLVSRKSLASKHDVIQRNAIEQKTSLDRYKESSFHVQELEKKLVEVKSKVG